VKPADHASRWVDYIGDASHVSGSTLIRIEHNLKNTNLQMKLTFRLYIVFTSNQIAVVPV
jgi:hypothetical protein